jgi:hypothetical protein
MSAGASASPGEETSDRVGSRPNIPHVRGGLPRPGDRKRSHGRSRWPTFLMLAAMILVAGTVVADVVLTYNVFNNTGANAASPFDFVNGGNYGTAHALGLITTAYTAPANQVTTSLSGVEYVTAEIYDVIEFDTAVATATTYHITSASLVTIIGANPAGVVCAYAFLSDAAPSAGTVAVAGEPAGCGAVTPTLGARAAACTGATWVAGVATINLLTGGTVANSPGTCNIATGVGAGTIAEYVSYAVYVNGAVAAGTALNTFGIPITAP